MQRNIQRTIPYDKRRKSTKIEEKKKKKKNNNNRTTKTVLISETQEDYTMRGYGNKICTGSIEAAMIADSLEDGNSIKKTMELLNDYQAENRIN